MKKILFLLSMVLATYTVALTLTACSGEDDRKEEKQTPNTPTKEDPKNNDGPTANELTVMTSCTPCNGGGKCPTCKGSGKGCKTCNGTGKHCDTCGGTGKHCSTCGGTGKHCSKCGGTGKHCDTCGGTGKHCETCGGTGKHCATCGGTGKWCYMCGTTGACVYCSDGNCDRCHGTGKKNCVNCGGNGRCTTCQGRGWTGNSSNTCATCRGSKNCHWCNGQGSKNCDNCYGSGKCRQCNGSRKCSTCYGNPICSTCNGKSVCKSCNGNPVCKSCNGNPVCKSCNGNPVCKSCDGKAICKSCNGTASCKSCGGDGHCADCANSDGKCKTCSGTGEVTLSSVTFSNEGGSERFQIHCDGSWNASTAADWIKLSSPSGSGNSSFTIIADANKTTSTRSDKVTFSYSGKSLTITVTQSGEPLALSVSPNSINFSEGGGNQSVTITSNTDWTVSNSAEWLHLSAESGNGNGTLTITADENSTTGVRKETIQLKYGTKTVSLSVSQSGVPPIFNLSNTTVEFTDQGGENTLTITSNTDWKASKKESWIKLSAYSGSGNSNLTITADENFYAESREATIEFTYNGKTVTVSVNQIGKEPVEMKLKDMLSKVMGTISVDFKNESLASIISKAEKSYELGLRSNNSYFYIWSYDNDNCKNLVYHGVPFNSFYISDEENYRWISYKFRIKKSSPETTVALILQDFKTEMGVELKEGSSSWRYNDDKVGYRIGTGTDYIEIDMHLYH